MYILLIVIVWALFIAILFLNIYFRVKVLKVYKILVQNRVEFGTSHFFDKQKLETEVLSRYPEQRENILTFVNHIQYSMRLATVLITLITIFGGILMYYRE